MRNEDKPIAKFNTKKLSGEQAKIFRSSTEDAVDDKRLQSSCDASSHGFPFEVRGNIEPGFLDRKLSLSLGEHINAKNHGTFSFTIGKLLSTVMQHKVGKKDGQLMLQGCVARVGSRCASNMSANQLMLVDCDNGYPIEETLAKIEEKELAYFLHTTFSHMKSKTEISEAKFNDWAQKSGKLPEGGTPTEQCVAYLLQEKYYNPAVLEGAEYFGKKHREDGVAFVISHQPMPRYRIMFFLKDPFAFCSSEFGGPSGRDLQNEWKRKYAGLCAWLGLSYDTSCVDPSRAMYLPRVACEEDLKDHRAILGAGALLDLGTVEPVDVNTLGGKAKATSRKGKAKKSNRSMQTPEQSDAEGFKTTGLLQFLAIANHHFQIVDFLRDQGYEISKGSADDERVHFFCPNHELHSDPENPSPFFVSNGKSFDESAWVACCMTDGCKQRWGNDRARILDYVCQERGIDEARDLMKWADGAVWDDSAEFRGSERLGGLPEGFDLHGDRICVERLVETRFGKKEPVLVEVCSILKCVARMRDPGANGWGRQFEFTTEDKKDQRIFVLDADLAGDVTKVRAQFADAGLWIGTGRFERDAFSKLLNTMTSTVLITSCRKPGWYKCDEERLFVTPLGETIGAIGGNVGFKLDDRNAARDMDRGGSLENWQQFAVDCFDVNTPHWQLALCSGAAGTVIELLGEESCGINWCGSSSVGKTTSQIIAAAMWANPAVDRGLLHTCRTTDNGLEFLLERGNGTSFHLDEGKTGNPLFMSDLAFLVAGGTGKKRMRADGGQRETANWSTFVTVSSEKPLSDFVKTSGKTEVSGMHVRMPALNVSQLAPIDPADARAIKQGMLANYGHAGPAFVRAIIQKDYHRNHDELRQMVNERQRELAATAELSTVDRVARLFAILWVCGEILSDAGIVPVSKEAFASAVKWGWTTWHLGDDAAKLAPARDSVDRLLVYLQTTPGKVRPTAEPQNAHHNIVAYYDAGTVYLPKDSIREIPGLQSDKTTILDELDRRGLLIWQKRNRIHSHIPGVGSNRPHYRVKLCLYETSFGAAHPVSSDDGSEESEEEKGQGARADHCEGLREYLTGDLRPN